MQAIKIAAPNDANGNPQRGWLITDERGCAVEFVDEGYQGTAALTSYRHDLPSYYPTIQVSQAEYRRWRRGVNLASD